MSKARTLANLISDNAELADGQISVAEVVGAAPTASPTFTGNIDAGDNVKIRLGDSDDLQIYHDGSTSFIVIWAMVISNICSMMTFLSEGNLQIITWLVLLKQVQ